MANSGEGAVRIVFQDASGTRRDVVYGETRTEPLRGAAAGSLSADPRLLPQVPAGQAALEEDDKLVVEMKGDAATAVNYTSTVRIPVRIQNKKTKVVRETYLTGGDLGLVAGDVTVNTTFTTIGSYTINAQESLKLGHATQVNSQIGMAFLHD